MNMAIKTSITISSRQFNQDTARAKKAAEGGPVFITTRGEPTHVLMTKAQFDRLETPPTSEKPAKPFISLAEMIADNSPEADFDWEPPRLSGFSLKVPDFE